ncbi:phytoene/squalene synthase family protein [Nocardia shimofusensis]|uniref:phytoene/squalene synthase family protein n=1 Tax=Nocardia shimofusensis TaxID=228596 RepID=UPI00082DC484|nr:phytoene/squalene synthase family protein [Nocardia shimofusensis]
MTQRELAAARITDPALRQAYTRCRELNAAHGRTYFLATRLLPPDRRPAVHALYGFARYVDDLVDIPGRSASPEAISTRIDEAEQQLTDALADYGNTPGRGTLDADARTGRALTGSALDSSALDSDGRDSSALDGNGSVGGGNGSEGGGNGSEGSSPGGRVPVALALADTVRRYAIDPALFSAFLSSMRMDLLLRDYPTRADLQRYTYGSAQVIGLQLLPVLGTVTDRAEAAPFAAALGDAFQLTNFLRDIAEDLDRGRIYLPADELAAFGVDRGRLEWCRAHGLADAAVRAALTDQVATTRAVYRRAAQGIEMLSPWARPCVATAYTLYSEILNRIEYLDYNVFARRATVGATRKLRVAGPAAARAWWVRRSLPSEPARTARPTS